MSPPKESASGQAGAGQIKSRLRSDSTPAASKIKRLIVWLACWGLLPIKAADWLIRRGGLRHE